MGLNSKPSSPPEATEAARGSVSLPAAPSFAPDPAERFRRSLPPELVEELDKLGVDPQFAPSPQQWLELLPRLAGLIRARSFGRDGVALSHELRTPMTVVIGATELLLESHLDADQRATVEGVRSSGQELLSILNQVLDEPGDPTVRSVPPALEVTKPEARIEGRVLVVEDNEFNQALISHALVAIGCQVDAASNGMDAIAKISSEDYDIILMDCHMTGLDGFETSREIRRLERGESHVPIIAVTAGGVPEMRRACLAAGMDDYVAKPFNLATLRARVAYWISRARDSARAPAEAPLTVPVPSQEGTAHLDLSRLEELATEAGTPMIAVELTSIFLEDMVKRLQSFAEAAAAHDRGACLSFAHAIKGACGNFGAVGMARLAEETERRAKAGFDQEIAALVVRLSEELSLVRALLDERGLVATPGVKARPMLGRRA